MLQLLGLNLARQPKLPFTSGQIDWPSLVVSSILALATLTLALFGFLSLRATRMSLDEYRKERELVWDPMLTYRWDSNHGHSESPLEISNLGGALHTGLCLFTNQGQVNYRFLRQLLLAHETRSTFRFWILPLLRRPVAI